MLQINSSKDVFKAIKEYISRPEQEEVFIISLNPSNSVKSIKFVALGDVDRVVIPFKYIYQQLCIETASGAILVHTHPSGEPNPSTADIQMTRQLRDGLNALGIGLCDHVIVSEDKFFSFAEEQTFNA